MALDRLCRGCRAWWFAFAFMVTTITAGCAPQGQRNMSDQTATGPIEREVDTLFNGFANVKFVEFEGVTEVSGWTMELSSGRVVTRSFLRHQAEPVIGLGPDAVPHVLRWVMHDDLPIRYIAVYSLQQLTGLSPHVPYFDKEDHQGHREKAIKEWQAWWEARQNQRPDAR
jgi:hypothetical protein